MPSLSRRSLLSAASVIGATAAVSAAATTASAAETGMSGKAGPRDETYDIVIVGSGCAGLSAAIEAGDLGAKAVVIEKMPRPMGNTIYAGGNFNATCTWVQKKADVTDTVDAFYKDMMMVSRGRGDPKLTRMFCEQSAGVVQWVTDRCHMTWKPLDIQIAPMLARCHEVAGKLQPGGSQLTRNMMEEVKKLGVPVLFNTKVIELLHDDKLKCTGVRVLDKNGSRNIYTKGGVILCTGGFHANKGMVTQYISGSAAWMPLRGSNCCTGENVTLTAPFFPQLLNMDQFHAGPIHGPTRANPSNMVNFGICVDPRAHRYIDEASTYVAVAQNTPKRVPENQAYIILDSQVVDVPIVKLRFQRYQKANAKYFQANTIEELAKLAGLPPAALAETVNTYNKAVLAGNGASLKVPATMKPKPHDITKPPFYAFPFMGGMTATFGGPKINEFAQIINTENKPIDGLYGAGNAVGGIFYDNYLDGSQLTAAVIWGRIAAQQTAKRAKGAAA